MDFVKNMVLRFDGRGFMLVVYMVGGIKGLYVLLAFSERTPARRITFSNSRSIDSYQLFFVYRSEHIGIFAF